MSKSSFRRFEFFDVETIADDVSTEFESTPTCATAEGGMLIFGDNLGRIILTDRSFSTTDRKHKIFRGEVKGIAYLYDLENHNRQYIVAIGDDSPQSENPDNVIPPAYYIKIYTTTDFSRPIQTINATASNGAIFSSFAVLQDGNQIAVGYSTGTILLFVGALMKDGMSVVRNIPPIVLMQTHQFPISGLHFCEIMLAKNNSKRVRLFAVLDSEKPSRNSAENNQKPPEPSILPDGEDPAESGTLVFDTTIGLNSTGTTYITSTIRKDSAKVLDARGASPFCSSFMKNTSELVVGRPEAVYNYSVEDKGGALAVFGDKLSVCAVGRYTLVVSVEEKNITPGTIVDPSSVRHKKPVINIYDLKNKIICGTSKKYQLSLNERILFSMFDSGAVYLVTSNFHLIRFQERSTQQKIDVILSQGLTGLFPLAITLAAEEHMEASDVVKLYKRYGDRLYEQGDFDGATLQYSRTIGYVPPAYVIMKFLDPYRIMNLINYLEQLHQKRLANCDHITLLLTCYTKMKDENRLNSLLEGILSYDKESDNSEGESESKNETFAGFDAAKAIETLRSAGYSDFALKIAAKYHQHEAYLDIQLSKFPALYEDAIAYVAYVALTGNTTSLLSLLRCYGRTLLQHRAQMFTVLMIKLCTAEYTSLLTLSPLPSTNNSPVPTASSSATSTSACTGKLPTGFQSMYVGKELKVLFEKEGVKAAEWGLPVEEVLFLFCEDKIHLLVLLEGIRSAAQGRILTPKVSSTLIEMYLELFYTEKMAFKKLSLQLKLLNTEEEGFRVKADEIKEKMKECEGKMSLFEGKVMGVLDGALVKYDSAHLLLLCQSYDFDRGQSFLLEKQQAVPLLMRSLIEQNDAKEIFKLLRREGSEDPELYVQVLTYFVDQSIKEQEEREKEKEGNKRDSDDDSEENDDEDRWNMVIDVVDLIEKEGILSPMQVITILAKNPQLPLHVASNYIHSSLKEQSEALQQQEADVALALSNLSAAVTLHSSGYNQQKSKTLRAQERQQQRLLQKQQGYNKGKNQTTVNPFVDFDDDEDDDEAEEEIRLREEKERERWTSIRKAQLDCSMDHESFYKELELSSDGFNCVAGFFGRSIIS